MSDQTPKASNQASNERPQSIQSTENPAEQVTNRDGSSNTRDEQRSHDTDETPQSNTVEGMIDYTDDDDSNDQTAVSQLIETVKEEEVCVYHTNAQATYIRVDVCEPVCAECFMNNRGWEVTLIDRYVNDIGQQLLKEKKNIISRARKAESFEEKLAEMKTEEESKRDERSKKIKRYISRLCEIITEVGDGIITENVRRTNENISPLHDGIEVWSKKKRDLVSRKESVDGTLRTKKGVIELKKCLDDIKEYTASLGDINDNFKYPEIVACIFRPVRLEETLLNQLIGELHCDTNNTDSEIELKEIIKREVSKQFESVIGGEELWARALLSNEKGNLHLEAALRSKEGNIFLRRFFKTEYAHEVLANLITTDMPYMAEKLLNVPGIHAFIASSENFSIPLISALLESDMGKCIISKKLQSDERFEMIENILGNLNEKKRKVLMQKYLFEDKGNQILHGWFQTNEGTQSLYRYITSTNGKRFHCKVLRKISDDVIVEVLKCPWLQKALQTTQQGREVVKQFLATDVGRGMAKSRLDADRPPYMKGIEFFDINSLSWTITNSEENGKLAIKLELNVDGGGSLNYVNLKINMVLENTKSCTESIKLENVVHTFLPGSSYMWNNIIPLTTVDDPNNGFIDAEGHFRLKITWDLVDFGTSPSNLQPSCLPFSSTRQSMQSLQTDRIYLVPVSRNYSR